MFLAELGVTPEEATAHKTAQQMANDPEIPPQPTLAEAMAGNRNAVQVAGEKEENSGANVTAVLTPPRGNRSEYLIRRLKRDAARADAPNHDQAALALGRLQRGEITSARRAAIEAGIVHVPTLLEIARKAVLKMPQEQRQQLFRWMDSGCPEDT